MQQCGLRLIAFTAAVSLFAFEYMYQRASVHLGSMFKVLGMCNIILAMLTKESIPFLLANNQDDKALKVLIECRGENTASMDTLRIFTEIKSMHLSNTNTEQKTLFTQSNLSIFATIIAFRLLALLTTNIPIMAIICSSSALSMEQTNLFLIYLGSRLINATLYLAISRWSSNSCNFYYNLAIINGIALLLISSPFRINLVYLKEFVIVYLFTNNLMAFGIDALKYEHISRFIFVKWPWSIAIGDIYEQFVHAILFVLCTLHLCNVVIVICGLGCLLIAFLLRFGPIQAMRQQFVANKNITMNKCQSVWL